jgi:hypothetical protein
VKRGPPTMVKDDKGRWVKPDRATLQKMKEDWEADQAGLRVEESHKAQEHDKRERLCAPRWAPA